MGAGRVLDGNRGGPRFSLIVPAHEGGPFIEKCLWSIESQNFTDFEVVLVDDASTDATAALFLEATRRDARFTARTHVRRAGAGAARNTGLDLASGEYLLFLDVDDVLSDEAVLADVDARLRELGDPDILFLEFLFFDFSELRPCERHGDRNRDQLGARPQTSTFRAVDYPEVVERSWVPWNKAYRRALVEEADLRFPDGYYEDSVWSVKALLVADRIAIIDRVCVLYRCCRAGSYSARPSAGHLSILAQYAEILRLMDARPEAISSRVTTRVRQKMSAYLHDMVARRVVPSHLMRDLEEGIRALGFR